jgi:hypothetical protein
MYSKDCANIAHSDAAVLKVWFCSWHVGQLVCSSISGFGFAVVWFGNWCAVSIQWSHRHLFLGVAGEGLVVTHAVQVVLPVPAGAAEVAVTLQLTTEVGALLNGTQTADSVLQVRVHLNLQAMQG